MGPWCYGWSRLLIQLTCNFSSKFVIGDRIKVTDSKRCNMSVTQPVYASRPLHLKYASPTHTQIEFTPPPPPPKGGEKVQKNPPSPNGKKKKLAPPKRPPPPPNFLTPPGGGGGGADNKWNGPMQISCRPSVQVFSTGDCWILKKEPVLLVAQFSPSFQELSNSSNFSLGWYDTQKEITLQANYMYRK